MDQATELALLREVYLAAFIPLHAMSTAEQMIGWRALDAKVRLVQAELGVEPGTKATGMEA
jgi:hypothetical protein